MGEQTFCIDCGMTLDGACSHPKCRRRRRKCPSRNCGMTRTEPCSSANCQLREDAFPYDTDFYYFKPGGKWKYDGEGYFPNFRVKAGADRYAEIAERHGGKMPGIMGDGRKFVIVVIPRPSCDVRTAFPYLIYPNIPHPDTERIQMGEYIKRKYPALGDENG